MDKGAKNKLAGPPGENGGGLDAQKDLHSRSGRDETKRKTQERMEKIGRKRSSSTGSEKMEIVGDREKWRGIVRQVKAHSGLYRQRKKKKKNDTGSSSGYTVSKSKTNSNDYERTWKKAVVS
jgi:hypothetical protein